MGLDESYIKLHRKMTDWEWYSDLNTKVLFLHMLIKANWKSKDWQGKTIERGQFISSYSNLATETGLTVGEIRTALKRLKSTGEVTHKAFNKFGLFTVVNYDKYQYGNSQDDSQPTVREQSISSPLATTKERKEGKISKKEKNLYTDDFENFWNEYPRKVDKGNCFKIYNARLKEGHTAEQLLICAMEYRKDCEQSGREQKYIKHGATFLSETKPFLDCYKEPAKPPEQPESLKEESNDRFAGIPEEIRKQLESDNVISGQEIILGNASKAQIEYLLEGGLI